jgi:RNA polymerase sigma-70 factor (ECF subfamily)
MRDLQKLSDEEVVEIIITKDKEAYAEIIKRYEVKLLRYATYLLNDNQKAQDTLQESFIKAFVNLNSFNNKFKFSSWIYRIVHNEAINHINKNKNEKSLFKDTDLEDNTNLEDEYSKKEIVNMVKTCVEQMPILYKEPLTLFYLEDKSYTEISDILRLPTSTVGVRITRAKALMKKICLRKNK